MLLSKKAIETVAIFTAKEDAGRPTLTGVLMEETGQLVGTDGHILGIVSPSAIPSSEYPAFPGCPEQDPAPVPCIIPTKEMLDAAKRVPKARRHGAFPVLQHVYFNAAASNANGTATLHTTDLETVQTVTAKKIDGNFPKYDVVMPKGEPIYKVCLNADLLGRLAKAAKTIKPDAGQVGVELAFYSHDGLGGIGFSVNGDEQTLTGVVMPMRGKHERYGLQEEPARKALAADDEEVTL